MNFDNLIRRITNKDFLKRYSREFFLLFVLYRNWPPLMLVFFGLIKPKKTLLIFRNGLKIMMETKHLHWRRNGFGMISEIFARKEYAQGKFKLKKGDIVLDVGAHVGSFSIFAAQKVGDRGRVFAFEPGPETFKLLSETINLNKLPNVKIFNEAIFDKTGKLKFYTSDTFSSFSLVQKNKKSISVKTRTLKSVFNQLKIKRCDLLKTDVEGAEFRIFKTTPVSILKKIDKIAMEYHHTKKGSGKDIGKLAQKLKEAGFKVDIIPYPENSPSGHLYATR